MAVSPAPPGAAGGGVVVPGHAGGQAVGPDPPDEPLLELLDVGGSLEQDGLGLGKIVKVVYIYQDSCWFPFFIELSCLGCMVNWQGKSVNNPLNYTNDNRLIATFDHKSFSE